MSTDSRPDVSHPDALVRRVHDRLADRAAAAADPRVTVGDRLLAVEVDHPDAGRLAGVAHRPQGEVSDAWPDTVTDLAALAVESPSADHPTLEDHPPPDAHLRRAVGVATLSALSAPDVDWQPGDPMAALPADVERIATVGLFGPALRKFDGCEVRVVERRTGEHGTAADGDTGEVDADDALDAPPGVDAVYPPEECRRAFEGADVCFVTGSTLVYGGLDRYLAAAGEDQPVVLVGATASVLPGPAFEAGVDVVAGARVTDPERVRERVAAGDCGTDLHDEGLEKCYVASGEPTPALSLPGGAARNADAAPSADAAADGDGGHRRESEVSQP